MNATGVVEEVRATLQRDHAELTQLASKVEPGCGGMICCCFTWGNGFPICLRLRAPSPAFAKGGWNLVACIRGH